MNMKRYKNLVFEVEKGITVEISEEINEEVLIRIASSNVNSKLPTVLAGEYAEALSMYTDNYGNKAVIPQGWTVSGVPNENIIWGKDKGLVIYNIPKEKVSNINWKNHDEVESLTMTYDQFVWIPVELLTPNSTFDGIHFDQKFGRMNYKNYGFSERKYNEPIVCELLSQKESSDKYGGYYSSRYKISKDKETGKPRSVSNAIPWRLIDFPTAKMVAMTMVENKTVTSHLMYGAEYDTREKWAIETSTVTIDEIVEDSTTLGNYRYNRNYPRKLVKTGKDGCINNIYGFAGNLMEWTQERYFDSHRVIRNGVFYQEGSKYPVDHRQYIYPYKEEYDIGFSIALCIK